MGAELWVSLEQMSLTPGRAATIQPRPLGVGVLRDPSPTGHCWEGAGWGLAGAVPAVLILCGCASAQGGGESVMLMCNRLQPCGVKCLFSLIHCLGV